MTYVHNQGQTLIIVNYTLYFDLKKSVQCQSITNMYVQNTPILYDTLYMTCGL